MQSNIVIHDGERAIFFGAAEDSIDPVELVFPATLSERGPLVMSTMDIEHRFGVWHDFHAVEIFHAQDEPKSICVQWCVTPEVLDQLEALAEGDYGIAVMPIAEMLNRGSVEVQEILRSLAGAPADDVTSELRDSEGELVDPAASGGWENVDGSWVNMGPA